MEQVCVRPSILEKVLTYVYFVDGVWHTRLLFLPTRPVDSTESTPLLPPLDHKWVAVSLYWLQPYYGFFFLSCGKVSGMCHSSILVVGLHPAARVLPHPILLYVKLWTGLTCASIFIFFLGTWWTCYHRGALGHWPETISSWCAYRAKPSIFIAR